MKYNQIIKTIKSMHDPKAVEGMARFGINPENNYGVSISKLRLLAKNIGKDHELALKLWDSGIHDARLLAPLLAEPGRTDDRLMEKWVADFDSWDICDGCCGDLFTLCDSAYEKAEEWSSREEEFVKRSGFVLMARLAVKDKTAQDHAFLRFLPMIEREAEDERNYVKKAINWALRQIGKRNLVLNAKALKTARRIRKFNSKTARWIAADAIRELSSEKVRMRLRK